MKRKPITCQKARHKIKIESLSHWLIGFAVVMRDLYSGQSIEFWKYDPALLTVKQRKAIGVIGWKKICVAAKEGDNG